MNLDQDPWDKDQPDDYQLLPLNLSFMFLALCVCLCVSEENRGNCLAILGLEMIK